MSPFDLDGWLKGQQQRVEGLLSEAMRKLSERAPKRIVEAMGYSLLAGGKRLRPILCLAFSDAVSHPDKPNRLWASRSRSSAKSAST